MKQMGSALFAIHLPAVHLIFLQLTDFRNLLAVKRIPFPSGLFNIFFAFLLSLIKNHQNEYILSSWNISFPVYSFTFSKQ